MTSPDPLDALYTERSQLIAALAVIYPSSIEDHEGDGYWDENWRNVIIIDLPTGQVSWHIAKDDLHLFEHVPRKQGRKWDGHDSPTKYARLARLHRDVFLPGNGMYVTQRPERHLEYFHDRWQEGTDDIS
ncbi:hypothetical protein [Deinococcus sp. Leaf326]|uniref:WDGH domain-containing protein n=1 Tax=Deinococcus sp. Leaf326 TaxID=1736338 RepID=UPI000700B79F|nr:hypothetical protein [Deinococcus sp. Leaf326]KQR22878.1 hypothetical protein ASF71_06845 [Deinococcus sp. Leaf326]